MTFLFITFFHLLKNLNVTSGVYPGGLPKISEKKTTTTTTRMCLVLFGLQERKRFNTKLPAELLKGHQKPKSERKYPNDSLSDHVA